VKEQAFVANICIQTDAFPTDPEGDLELCNGMPGSHLAGWVRDGLLEKGYASREPVQEDYGWGFHLEERGCPLWISVSYATPVEGDPEGIPEWHVGVDILASPWPFGRWGGRRRGREIEKEVFALVREMIESHPGVKIVRNDG
jgi:hypothetical protein